jgi:alanine racemase
MQSRPTATIHLSNIVQNWKSLCARAPGGKTAAVVKANAYGHGAAEVGEALHDAGCDIFFVAYAFEGEQLRKALGPHALIFVLNGPAPDDADLYRSAALSAVINSPKQYHTLHNWLQNGSKISYALHFDTGMNRLGLRPSDAAKLADVTKAHPPAFIMSHLACSDDTDNPMNTAQHSEMTKVALAFPSVPVSFANSGGVMLGDGFVEALPRPGIALYGGGAPVEGLTLHPGLTLTAPILAVHIAKAGDTVGYGAAHTLKADTPLATVALGYADGMLRSGANRLIGYIAETPCPVVGRISMDLITIDVSKAQTRAKAGTGVEFIGKTATVEAQAARCGTIGYELLTGLSERVERIYES